jgi:hypothetical protein
MSVHGLNARIRHSLPLARYFVQSGRVSVGRPLHFEHRSRSLTSGTVPAPAIDIDLGHAQRAYVVEVHRLAREGGIGWSFRYALRWHNLFHSYDPRPSNPSAMYDRSPAPGIGAGAAETSVTIKVVRLALTCEPNSSPNKK